MIRNKRTTRNIGSPSTHQMMVGGSIDVLEEEPFKLELLKEIFRADRRNHARDFGLIRLLFRSKTPRAFLDSGELTRVAERLRITDTLGWYESSIAVLLPETDKDGTLTLANDITRICIDAGFDVDTEISIYPFDDELISMADEIQNGEVRDDSDDSDHDSLESDSLSRDSNGTANGRNGQGNSSRIDFAHEGPAPGNLTMTMEARSARSATEVKPLEDARGTVRKSKHRFVPTFGTPWWKRGIDILGAGLGLCFLSPIFFGAAIAIKLSSKGPVFFRQMREGKDGREFGILKLRTMVVDAEELQEALRGKSEQDGPAFKLTDDPRVTAVGRYLRKSCIDELPQLWNVLTGEMSLVGPRPLPIAESKACTAWQRVRLTVLPGLTCTWQAHGGRDVKFAQWMRMDLDYIERRSFLFDLRLIVETAFIALLHRGSV